MEEIGLVPDSSVVFGNGELKKFGTLVDTRQELKSMIKGAEEEIKALDAKLTEMLTQHDTVKVQHSDYRVSLCQGSSSSLSKDRLLQLGVTATVIAQATTSKTYTYLLVSVPKPKV